MSRMLMTRVSIMLFISMALLFQISCGTKATTDLENSAGSTGTGTGTSTGVTGVQEEAGDPEGKADIQKGGEDKAGIFRVMLLYPDSPYRTAESKGLKTDMIAFQILSIEADGTFGSKHNFMPEYEVSFDGKDELVIMIMGKPTDEYEEMDMDMSKSAYLSSYEKTVSDEYITYKFKTKTAIKFSVVEYFMDFIDFYVEIDGD